MNRLLALLAACLLLTAPPLLADTSQQATQASPPETVRFSPFGEVTVYKPSGRPTGLALFLSGDGGWNLGVVDMARLLVTDGVMVAGIDFPGFLRTLEAGHGACAYPAADLERLAHFLEARDGFTDYIQPTLVGYSSGATAVYGALVQAPVGTFAGGLMLSFCPDLPLHKPWCRGSGLDSAPRRDHKGTDFLPAHQPSAPMIVLQGGIDQVCDAAAAGRFMASVPGSRFELLPKVGHGYSVPRNWAPQYLAAWQQLNPGPAAAATTTPAAPAAGATTPPVDVSDLPLVEVTPQAGGSRLLAVMLSGDGGWAGIDREVAAALAARGIDVVGWNSLRYFWKARDPAGAASDLARVLRHYMQATGRQSVLLVGYSQGADTLPFMVDQLPADLLPHIRRIALIAPGRNATFEFHVSTWLGKDPPGPPTAPAIAKLPAGTLTCLYGTDDKDSPCRGLEGHGARAVELQGGHHFEGDYRAVAAAVLAGLGGDQGVSPQATPAESP